MPRKLAVLSASAACLAAATPAEARHYPCSWSPGASVDPADPWIVTVRHDAMELSCPFGSMLVTVAAGGHEAHVRGDGEGVRWEVDPPEPAPPAPATAEPSEPTLLLTVSPRRVVPGRRVRFRVRARWDGTLDAEGVDVRFAGRRLRTDHHGFAVVRARLRPGVRRAVASVDGEPMAAATVRAQVSARSRSRATPGSRSP